MLCQTHNPHFFSCQPFTSISLSAATTSSLLASSAVEEMECVEATSEASISKDDFFVINAEDDFVNGFFDFSNDDGFNEETEPREQNANISLPPKQDEQVDENDLKTIVNFEAFGPVPGDLVLPADDVENLEWLSHFVEDSFKGYSSPAVTLSVIGKEKIAESKAPVLTIIPVNAPVPPKARRSKRVGTRVRVWSLDSSSSFAGSLSPWLICSNAGLFSSLQEIEKTESPKKKSTTQMVSSEGGIVGTRPLFIRRCCHCGVVKTPQWRTGPLGAKSLCNACGVRYKLGRLLPEYRPACSPTFSSDKHSNHHRKVLEMRRKKGLVGQLEPCHAYVPLSGC